MVRTAARTRAVRTVRPSRTVGAWRVLNDGKLSSFEPPCSPIGESVPRADGPHRLARLAAVGYHIAPSYVPQLHRLPLRASLSGCSWQARRRRRHGPTRAPMKLSMRSLPARPRTRGSCSATAGNPRRAASQRSRQASPLGVPTRRLNHKIACTPHRQCDRVTSKVPEWSMSNSGCRGSLAVCLCLCLGSLWY